MSAVKSQPLPFTPLELRGVIARNRVVVSPMCQYSSAEGGPTDFHLVHLGKFAMGGAGIGFCEETSVAERGRKSYHCAGIYNDAHIAQYRRINDFIRSQGAVPAIQIGHSRRKGSGCAPWDGYLIHQFLSPVTNQRTDAYGGDLAGRMRLCLDIVAAVRSVWPADRPVFMRVSAVGGVNSQWRVDDTVALVRAAQERGAEVVTTSSGGINGPGTATLVPRLPGYHVPYAERVRREANVKTIAVGLITEAHHAKEILQRGQADLIALACELLWNPNWPVHAARELGVPDYLDLLPRGYSWWLNVAKKIVRSRAKRRED